MKKTIIITGASSGLGAELARQYANAENKLFLFGRNKERLNKVASECRNKNSLVEIIIADVENSEEIQGHLNNIMKKGRVDIVIACAGVSAGTLGGSEKFEQVKRIFAINLNGVLNIIMPLVPQMIKNQSGNIVIVSSMAGLVGLSSCPSYSASKGAIRLFSEAIRGNLIKHNIHVSTVIPGYISTPMTDVNQFYMPLKIPPEQAAYKIIKGIEKNKKLIVFPKIIYIFLKLFSLLPAGIITYINKKLPAKKSME